MSTDQKNSDESNARGGYPLLALFFAVAASAVLAAVTAPVVALVNNDEVSAGEFWWASASVGAACMITGAFIGLYHYRRLLGVGLGIMTGGIIGFIVGPVILSPNYTEIMVTCLSGSVLLLVLGFICRILDPRGAR